MSSNAKFDFENKIEFKYAVGLGVIDGIIPIKKFGRSVAVSTLDNEIEVWTNNRNGTNKENKMRHLETFSDIYIASESGDDYVDILVVGIALNELNNWELVPEIIKLNGQTPKKLENKYIRIVEAYNNNSHYLLGDVWLTSNGVDWTDGVPNDYTAVQAHIPKQYQQTLMTHMTIPDNYYGILKSITLGIVGAGSAVAKNADIELKFRSGDKVFLTKTPFQVQSDGTGLHTCIAETPDFIGPRTDMLLAVTGVSANATYVNINYDLEFYRKDRMPDFLPSIILQ